MKHFQMIAAGLLIAGMLGAPLAGSQVQLRIDAGHRERHHVIHHPYHHPYRHRDRASVRIVVPERHHDFHPRNEDHDRDHRENH